MWLVTGSILMGILVGLHAASAHLLRDKVDPAIAAGFEAALRQHFMHAVGLIAVGLTALHHQSRWLDAAGVLFVVGLTLFCAVLYARPFFDVRPLLILNPFGGISFMAGWALFAVAAWSIMRR